jgi:predicted O-methyltransferase YrrM
VSEERWNEVERWMRDRVVPDDDALGEAVERSAAEGLPSIQVEPPAGKLLNLIARMIRAERILEIGTLGGYSTIWLARALPRGGRLISLEFDPHYADVARKNVAGAGLGEVVDIRVGPALDQLPGIVDAGEGPFDLVFIDADKQNQDKYLAFALDLTHVGSVIIGDNVVRGGRVIDSDPDHLSAGIARFIELLGTDPRIDATAIQTVGSKGWDGMAIGLVVEPSVDDR